MRIDECFMNLVENSRDKRDTYIPSSLYFSQMRFLNEDTTSSKVHIFSPSARDTYVGTREFQAKRRGKLEQFVSTFTVYGTAGTSIYRNNINVALSRNKEKHTG